MAEDNAKDAVKYGSVVALHVSKREDSYLQGVVLDWRKSPRDPHYNSEIETKTDEGIDFLIKVDGVSLKWIGDGSGEKGYCWRPKPAA